MDILAGLIAAVVIVGFGILTRQARSMSFYSTVLGVIALVYVLFAVLTGAATVIGVESGMAAVFVAVAVAAARKRSDRRAGRLLAGALVLHGVFDLGHDALIYNPAVPSWWPVFCAVVDIALGVWLIGLVRYAPSGISNAPSTP